MKQCYEKHSLSVPYHGYVQYGSHILHPILCNVPPQDEDHKIDVFCRDLPPMGFDILAGLFKVRPIEMAFYDLAEHRRKTIELNEVTEIYMENYYMVFILDHPRVPELHFYYNNMTKINLYYIIDSEYHRKDLVDIVRADEDLVDFIRRD